ncbi:hypothetical protein [uncultured Oscillibacter sp.]|uniref:hypothetical protein n=1 Tax=uncultured Oscillibacter sp. TaxID=876091 RepID=UPI0025E3858A|nr:hypothetical protein [uncultured Oscillibacter sp.]
MVKRHGLKKGLSLVLVLCLILSLMPTVALAQEPTAVTGTEAAVGVTGTEGTETTTPGGGETGTETTTPSTENGAGTTTPAAGEAGTGTTTPGGSETGTETTTPGAEDETEKDDPLDDFLDDVLKPLPGDTGDTTGQTGSGDTAGQTGSGDTNTNPDGSEGQTPNIPTVDVNGPKPEAPEGVVKPDTTVPQDPATAPSDPLPELPPTDSQPADGQPADGQPADGQPAEVPEVQEEATVTAEVTTEADESVTIAVTGPGLTGLTVEAVPSVTTLPAESEQVDYVAYDITPMAGDEPYTGEADVTIPVPAGWDEDAEIHGFVVNGKGAEEPVTVVEGTPSEDGTSYTFRAPHFSVMGLYADPQPLELTQVEVLLNVGQNTTYSVSDVDLRGNVSGDLDESIATVDVDYQEITASTTPSKVNSLVAEKSYYISDGNGNYLTLSGDELTNATKLEEATQWTYDGSGHLSAEGYYLRNDWGLAVTDRSSRASRCTYSDGVIYVDRASLGYYEGWNKYWTLGYGTSAGAYEKVTTEASKATVITITGKSAGETSVIVGDIKYNITVEEQAPAGALTGSTLKVEYWITNSTVTAGGAQSLTINMVQASTDEGVEIADLVPADGVRTGSDTEVMFWQAMRLDAQNHQTGDGGDDETADGEVFTRVRYNTEQSAWQYYGQDNVWHWFYSTDQAVAYYLQVTDVTQEVTTTTKDWGYDPNGTTPDTSGKKGQVALSVAVVYPDGKLSPAEDAIYRNSTTIFNFWENRNIGILAALNNDDYEVTKITVTNGTRNGNSSANVWYSDDSITWEKKTLENGSQWYNETEYWNESDGGVPTINGASMGITWIEKNTAKLVLIYIQPIEKETNLNVVWYDDSANNNIYSTQVVVSGTGNETFFNSLVQSSKVPQNGGTFTLDDDAYVVNSSNVHQTFNKDLATLQGEGIADQYRSGLYTYVKAELSADGKTLTLHYQIDDSKLAHQYVVDFGLPVSVPLSDLVEDMSTVQSVEVTDTTLATVESDKSITFQPDGVMDAVMVITAKITFNGGGTQNIRIGFVPASTVYYEEGFMDLDGFTGNPSKGTKHQTTSKLGAGTVYGYDAAYDGETGASNGSQATSNAAGSTASFSFTGTGVDIYANCNTGTGVVMIKVYDDASKLIKLLTVDTAMKNGDTPATENQAVTAYNIPIASIDGLSYDTYSVEIVHVADKNKEVKPVYLDGFRVHQPLGISDGNSYYGADTEAGAEISELRDAVLRVQLNLDASDSEKYKDQLANAKAQVYAKTGGEGASAVVLSYAEDGDVAIDILDNGPKNEIYLRQNETLVFEVDPSAQNVQVGLKLLTDGAACTINGKAVTSSTDMFYKVTPGTDGKVTIENTGTGLLAVTELKIAGK